MLLSNSYIKTQKKRDDGSYINMVDVKIDKSKKIEFHQITTEDRNSKFLNISQLFILKAKSRGFKNPVIIVWDAFEKDKKADEFFKVNESKEVLNHISLNSFIIYNLRYIIDNKNFIIVDKRIFVKEIKSNIDKTVQEVIDLLEKKDKIRVFMENNCVTMEYIYDNINSKKDCIAIGDIGYISTYCRKNEYSLAFNTSFFLLEDEDYFSEFSLLGDSHGMLINNGIIKIPPLYNRYCLLLNCNNKWEMKKISLRDLCMKCFGEEFDLSSFSFNEMSNHALYTRYFGVKDKGKTIGSSPYNMNNVDFIVTDCNVVGMKYYGEVQIPQNGFIFSIPINEYEKFSNKDFSVAYKFLNNSIYKQAIQCGPGLIKNGDIILEKDSLINEEFYKKHIREDKSFDFGVVPTDYAEDIDESRHARIVLCVDNEDNLELLAVEAVNKGMEIDKNESTGATLLEMAEFAKERGVKFALNLDGGGSTNIEYFYGQLIRYADRRGLPGVLYERMVPCVGVITDLNCIENKCNLQII